MSDIFNPFRDRTYALLWEEQQAADKDKKKGILDKLKARKAELAKAFETGCKPLVAEITPPCDFAQGNQHLARFVAGMLVPAEVRHLVSRGLFLWVSDPIALADPNAPYHVVLDAKLAFGARIDTVKIRPHFRLRNQAVIAIQAWFASHAARPGCVSIS